MFKMPGCLALAMSDDENYIHLNILVWSTILFQAKTPGPPTEIHKLDQPVRTCVRPARTRSTG
jgi:hypothetical protein